MFEPVGLRDAERVATPRRPARDVGIGAASRHPGLEQRPSVRAELAIGAMLNAARGGVARADASARSAPVQRKAIHFEGHTLDTSDMASFRLWCIGMARVHPERLHALMNHLFHQTHDAPETERIPDDERMTMLNEARRVLDAVGTGAVLGLPAPYEHILGEITRLRARLSVRAQRTAWRTVRAAALIDANAAQIAAAGGQAREAVLRLTGDMPSDGFRNESEDTVRTRASVLPAVWRALTTDSDRVAFLENGFGRDPCLAARLNGVAEYRAGQEGISEAALSGARYSIALGKKILTLAYAFFEDDDDDDDDYEPDWGAFRTYLKANHGGIADDPDFAPSFDAARLGF